VAKKAAKKKPDERPSFEEALGKLEGIVHTLEEGEIGLNEALAQYEQGVRLMRQAYDLLERAERRIELLSGVDADGNPVSRPVDDQSTLDAEESSPRGKRGRG